MTAKYFDNDEFFLAYMDLRLHRKTIMIYGAAKDAEADAG